MQHHEAYNEASAGTYGNRNTGNPASPGESTPFFMQSPQSFGQRNYATQNQMKEDVIMNINVHNSDSQSEECSDDSRWESQLIYDLQENDHERWIRSPVIE